jgi:hypothetical protein
MNLPEKQLLKTGCVFSLADSLSFICFADEAKHFSEDRYYSKMIHKRDNSWARSKAWTEYRTHLLSTALVQGGIDLLLPDHLSQTVSNAMCRNDGLDVLVDHPIETDEVVRLDKTYLNLFKNSRKLERMPDFTGIFSIDGIKENLPECVQPTEDNESSFIIEEYNYYLTQFVRQIEVVTKLSGPLFSAFVASQHATKDTIQSLFGPHFRDTIASLYDINPGRSTKAEDIDTYFLLREMNAVPRKGLDLLQAKYREVPCFPFPLNEVKDTFDKITEDETLSFGDYLSLGLRSSLCGPSFEELMSFWIPWFEFKQMLRISVERSSAMCFNVTAQNIAEIGRYPEATQLFRIYVTDINQIPRVNTYEDFLRLYHHPAIERFREQLAIWRQAVISGKVNIISRMRKDFRLALRDLSHATTLQTIGGMLTIIALPVAIGGILSGLPLDFAFTAIGPAILLESKRLANRASWVKFGDIYLKR